jgi:general secretion pathway protein F
MGPVKSAQSGQWWILRGRQLKGGLPLTSVFGKEGEWTGVVQRIEHGFPVTDALRSAGVKLDAVSWARLEAGERSGQLAEAMITVGKRMEHRSRRLRTLQGQLWYPALICLVGSGVFGLLIAFIIPEFRQLAEGFSRQTQLHWWTENVGAVYGFSFAFLVSGLGFLIAIERLLRLWATHSLSGGLWRNRILGSLPIAGRLRRLNRQYHFLERFGHLLQAGVPLPSILSQERQQSSDQWEAQQWHELELRLTQGTGFERSLQACPLLDAESTEQLSRGQAVGELDRAALERAEDLQMTLEWNLEQSLRLVEPLMIASMSVATAGLVLAYVLPMIQMLESGG